MNKAATIAAILLLTLTSAYAADSYKKGKYCSPFAEGGNRIAFPVPDSWTITDCIRFGQIAKWKYFGIGCMGPHELVLWDLAQSGDVLSKLADTPQKCGW